MEQPAEPLTKSPKGISAWASIAIYVVSFSVFITVLSSLLYLLMKPAGGTAEVKSWSILQLIAMQLVTLLSALLPALFLLRFLDHRPFSDLGFSLRGRGKDLLYGLLMAVLLYAIGFGLSLLLGVVRVTGVQFEPMQLLGSFCFFILVALAEELMIRGYVLGCLLRTRMNKFLALFLSSILFACLHLFNPNVAWIPMLNLVLAGILLGVAYLYTRNLWFPISLHLFWNWIQGPLLGYEVSGNQLGRSLLSLQLSGNTLLSGGTFGFEGSILCTGLMVIFILSLIGWFERKSRNPY